MAIPYQRPVRATLDGQLVTYWDREAARLDALAAGARFGWQRRRLLRKATEARAKAERSRLREAARNPAAAEPAAPEEPARAEPARAEPARAEPAR